MNILDNITTATRVNLQPGDVLFLDMKDTEINIELFEPDQLDNLKKTLNDAFGHEVKFILTCNLVPYIVSHPPMPDAIINTEDKILTIL